MFRSLVLVSKIHISHSNWSSSKTQLLKLRKKTGYPFESCKKALELNSNSLEKVISCTLYVLLHFEYVYSKNYKICIYASII